MNTVRKLWKSVKRNPVINGFAVALLAQLLHDYLAHEIDWTNISGYIATLFIGVGVRELTVPAKEHKNLVNNYKALLAKHMTGGDKA